MALRIAFSPEDKEIVLAWQVNFLMLLRYGVASRAGIGSVYLITQFLFAVSAELSRGRLRAGAGTTDGVGGGTVYFIICILLVRQCTCNGPGLYTP